MHISDVTRNQDSRFINYFGLPKDAFRPEDKFNFKLFSGFLFTGPLSCRCPIRYTAEFLH